MAIEKNGTAPLNQVPCANCGRHVDDRAPACPRCGERVYVEHPGGITPTKHPQLAVNRPDQRSLFGFLRFVVPKREK